VAEAVVSSNPVSGFTLIELVVVLVIVIAGATLLLPHLERADDRSVLKAESKRLGHFLRVAQSRAMARHGDVTVEADTEDDTVTLVEDNQVERLRVDLTSVTPPGTLVFSLDGGPSAAKTYTLVGQGGSTRTVSVAAGTGHVGYGP
jgi:prepilin-type N-terminal cleavage/methylation domain-containing protein